MSSQGHFRSTVTTGAKPSPNCITVICLKVAQEVSNVHGTRALLQNLSVNVVSHRVGNTFIRVIEDTGRSRLYLYHVERENEKHWHGISSIEGFFNLSYFWNTCLKANQDKHKHKCSTFCNECLHDACLKTDNQVGCGTCGRVCCSRACFERHKVGKKNSQ